jgi:hypothetical protein
VQIELLCFNTYALQVKFVPSFNSFFHNDYKSVSLVTPTSDSTVEAKFQKKMSYYAIVTGVEDMI